MYHVCRRTQSSSMLYNYLETSQGCNLKYDTLARNSAALSPLVATAMVLSLWWQMVCMSQVAYEIDSWLSLSMTIRKVRVLPRLPRP